VVHMKKQLTLRVTSTILFAGVVCPQVPDTAAGRQFSAWLEAFNMGDRTRISQFLETNYPSITYVLHYKPHVRGALRQSTHEVGVPGGAVGHVQPQPVALIHDTPLQPALNAV
jgi:hypothetical protein